MAVTYIVAILEDATMAEPIPIIGVSEQQIAIAVSLYLAATRPMTPLGRLEIGDAPADGPALEWLHEVLLDVEDIELTVYSTEAGMMPVGAFVMWVADHRDALERQHRPAVENVVDSL